MRILPTTFLLAVTFITTGCVTESKYAETGERVTQHVLEPESAAKNRMALGLQYLRNGNYSQAKFNLDKALDYAPNMPEVHYSLAYYYQTVNEIKHANEAYRRVLEIDPTNGDALNNYGAFLCQHNKIDDAELFFLKALEQDEYIRESQTYLNLGVCMLEHDKQDKALTYLQRALDHNPYNGKALLELSQISLSSEQLNEAKGYLQRYEKSSKLSARSLWLGYQIESKLNNKKAADFYGTNLVRYHPQSSQAQAYLKINQR